MRTKLAAALLALTGSVIACANAADSLSAGSSRENETPGAAADGADAGAAPSGALGPTDNGIILVHAAGAPAFRLCFQGDLDRLPLPDRQVMPQANVVGVEVGSAVRLAPLAVPPGEVYLFEEPLIRAFYPTFGGAGDGPTCQQLLSSGSIKPASLGRIDDDVSTGVHLLVVKGCIRQPVNGTFSPAECGADYNPDEGNLGIEKITLRGFFREQGAVLPTQVVQLSQALATAAAGQTLAVTFGDIKNPQAQLTDVVAEKDFGAFGEALPSTPVALPYDGTDDAVHASLGFRVELRPTDGGAVNRLDSQTLAEIQALSSPTDIPSRYYAAASNYVLLLLGDPNAKPQGDAGPDEREKLHIVAVPVIEPKPEDGGADLDGGAAPDGG